MVYLVVGTRCHHRWAAQVILLALGSQNHPIAELACSETDVPPRDIGAMHANGSDEDVQFDPQGAARFSRVDLYYTTTSAGLARAGTIAGESSYRTITYVCFDTDISASTEPLSVRSVTPTPAPSIHYHGVPEPPASPRSMQSIPTIRTEASQYLLLQP